MWLALHTSNALFDELAERVRKVSDESLGRDETYVCKASHIYSLKTFFSSINLHGC